MLTYFSMRAFISSPSLKLNPYFPGSPSVSRKFTVHLTMGQRRFFSSHKWACLAQKASASSQANSTSLSKRSSEQVFLYRYLSRMVQVISWSPLMKTVILPSTSYSFLHLYAATVSQTLNLSSASRPSWWSEQGV